MIMQCQSIAQILLVYTPKQTKHTSKMILKRQSIANILLIVTDSEHPPYIRSSQPEENVTFLMCRRLIGRVLRATRTVLEGEIFSSFVVELAKIYCRTPPKQATTDNPTTPVITR